MFDATYIQLWARAHNWMNGKQETLWGRIERRLMAMLDAVPNLTLAQLNEASFVWVEQEYQVSVHRELAGATPLERFIKAPSVLRDCPDSETLRTSFRIEVRRKQRTSDATATLYGVRFQIPQAFAHLRELHLRYARWDRSQADIVDPRNGAILATIYPLDKARNAHGQRRSIGPKALSSRALSASTTGVPQPTGDGHAPLMRQLLAQFAATGVPPAYIELEEIPTPSHTPSFPHQESNP